MIKKIITASIIVITIIGVFFLIGRNKSQDNSEYVGGVDEVDFSNYSVTELTTSNNITSGGVYSLSGNYTETIKVNATNADVKIILNNVSINTTNGPAIYIEEADNVYIEINGNNTITSNTTEELDAAIYSKADLCFIGDGTLNITSNYDGIKGSDDLEFDSGTYNITSNDDGIVGEYSLYILDGTYNIKSNGKGIKSSSTETNKGSITLIGGTYNITSNDDSINSNNSLTITGGIYKLSSTDDGLHAEKFLTISDGTINVIKSYEGIEGSIITISGGDIKVLSSDDGINASSELTIEGGNTYVNASGDGLDSNGNIYIKDGIIYVDGPTNNGNGSIDYGDENTYKFEVTGGTLIAVGTSGMAVSPTSGTTVTSLLLNMTSAYKGDITLGSITYSPTKAYNSILICSDKLKVGNTYKLLINNVEIESVTLSDTITKIGTSSMMGGPNNQGRR